MPDQDGELSEPYYERFPIPLVDRRDAGRPPVDVSPRPLAALRTGVRRRLGRRRLAILDTHFPWRLSGFRFHEFDEIRGQRPDTCFFSLFEMSEPFDAEVHALADFPRLAPALGITDVYFVFLNFAIGILGLTGHPDAASCEGWRDDISLWPTIEANGIRAHVTLYPGGGLIPVTPPRLLRSVSDRCASVFSNVAEVEAAIPDAVYSHAVTATGFYQFREREQGECMTLMFAADDRPRKGLFTLIDAFNTLDEGFRLHVVGPHERHLGRFTNPRFRAHGWLDLDTLRDLYWESDVFVSPVTTDAPGEGDGEPGMVDGFPTSTACDAVATGCALVSSNPRGEERVFRSNVEYLRIPEDDPSSLADALRRLRSDTTHRRELGVKGSERVRAVMSVEAGVAAKLAVMGLSGAPPRRGSG